MSKYLILYYSKTGNSKFLAEKLSKELSCDIEEIRPVINGIGFLFLISLLKISVPTNISRKTIEQYQEIIVIGPIWGGLLISPLRTIINKCKTDSKLIHFAVTCETKENEKDDKYGYNKVLITVKELGGGLVKTTEAFSTSLINNFNDKFSTKLSEKAKITEGTFSDLLRKKLVGFSHTIKSEK